MMIPWLSANTPFPSVDQALESPNGLLAAGADLSPDRLLSAYGLGIFPWYSAGEPILWWSPTPRLVLFPRELKISRSLAKSMRNWRHELRFDSNFEAVMTACAAPRPTGGQTWISSEMIDAYLRMHRLGYAHSVEIWCDGKLVGGLYGLAIGRVFFGESMFSFARDTSKMALVYLTRWLIMQGFVIIDCQVRTSHLVSLGAREMPRTRFSALLSQLIDYDGSVGSWRGAESRIIKNELSGLQADQSKNG